MLIARLLAAFALVTALAACRFEPIPDPVVSGKDAEWLALAPQPSKEFDPYRARYRIKDPTGAEPGTIVIDSNAHFLYFVEDKGVAIRYPISVGQDEYQWRGAAVVGRKAEWPTWTPMSEARKLNPDLPAQVAGGPMSPLGARGLYLYDGGKDTFIRIHGTNEPEYIGMNVSLGCIRMHNIDVVDLYNRTKVGTTVIVR
jgi:lipoprotein-anchoring transpeptidase ErfK/SrfK